MWGGPDSLCGEATPARARLSYPPPGGFPETGCRRSRFFTLCVWHLSGSHDHFWLLFSEHLFSKECNLRRIAGRIAWWCVGHCHCAATAPPPPCPSQTEKRDGMCQVTGVFPVAIYNPTVCTAGSRRRAARLAPARRRARHHDKYAGLLAP